MDVKIVVMILVAGVVQVSSNGAGIKWDYRRNGPSRWSRYFHSCGGKRQSPINIDTDETHEATNADDVTLFNYNKFFWGHYTMVNNGHALQINLPTTNNRYRVRKGKQIYMPLQVHIHFDPVTGKGSEHTLNSKKYFAEIHIVHANVRHLRNKQYMKHRDGLLVLAIFVDIVKRRNTISSYAVELSKHGASKLTKPGSKWTFLSGRLLSNFLPKKSLKESKVSYVTYKGSLTTPPCSQIVDWVLITGKVLVCDRHTARMFLKVRNSEGGRMAGNNRPIMNVNNRHIHEHEEPIKEIR